MITLRQRKQLLTFREAERAGPWDEFPLFPPGTDPQLCVSRGEVAQPFHVICGKDCMLVQMSGRGRVEYPIGPSRWQDLVPGDVVYVPAGMPHRVVPDGEGVVMRFKAEHPGLEGVAWYCTCGAELHRDVFDADVTLPQEAWPGLVSAFNASDRACPACGAVHPAVDVSWNRWGEIAALLRAGAVAPEG